MKHLIFGVDPGTTTAVAAVDLKGGLVGVTSGKEMGLSSAIEYIVSMGHPSVIACDVRPGPEFVSRIASNFGVTFYVPEKSLTVQEKLELTREYDVSDAHQRDALAAALHAFSQFRNKMQKIESLGLGEDVKHFVLQGKSISRACQSLEEDPEDEEREVEAQPHREPSEEEKQIRSLEKRVRVLSNEASERDETIQVLKEKLAAEKRRKHVKSRPKVKPGPRVKTLSRKVGELSECRRLLDDVMLGSTLLVGVCPNVVCGMALVEQVPESVEGLKAAFTSKKKVREHLLEKGVPVYDSSELQRTHGYYHINAEQLAELSEQPADVEGIIEKYRRKRS